MSLFFQIYSRTRKSTRLAALIVLGSLSTIAMAQQPAAPRLELFGGYSAYYPGTTASGLLPLGLTPISSCLCWNPRGAGASITYDFNRWAGITADMSGHWGNGGTTNAERLGEFSAYNISAGPKFTLRRGHFAPFVEVLFGGDRLTPELFHRDDRFGLLAGGGLDLRVGHHFAIRPFQADFVYSNHHFGSEPLVPATDVRGLRLQAGVVFLFGGHPPIVSPPIQAAPVVAPAPPPPPPIDQLTLALSASPSTLSPGDSSTITAVATSSLNRPLSYSYSASSGVINGTGTTATLTTAGVAAGAITVTGNVVDDTGNTATQTTIVNIIAAPIVTAAVTHPLGDITFDRDARRPTRVDNEAKATLDDVALTLQRDVNARLAAIGSAGSHEPHGPQLAAERAVNTKAYLVTEKGIDASRISVYTGPDDAKKVSLTLIPTGANLDTTGLTPVDEQTVIAYPRDAGRRHHNP